MKVISDRNVPGAYCEAFWKMRVWAKEGMSRNGPVMEAKDVFLEIYHPDERVLFDPVRLANPFFHMMEFIWMMSGSKDVAWIKQFNKNMESYAEENGLIHGAYGHRWRNHFGVDQIIETHNLLKYDRGTRRAVIGMWDPEADLFMDFRDLPCNTHIYATIEDNGLEFTVLNRSNDLIWGMLGANVVHMTMLQQILAESLGVPLASYKVFTKNLHIYKALPNFEDLWRTCTHYDPYGRETIIPAPILEGTPLSEFLLECEGFVKGHKCENHWLTHTAAPMRQAYLARIAGESGRDEALSVEAGDWREGALKYIEFKELARANSER